MMSVCPVPVAASLQDAALDPALWPQALDDLSIAASGAGAVLFSTNKHLAVRCSPNQQDVVDGYLVGGWDKRDERYQALPMARRKGVVTEDDFIDSEGIRHSPYYRDFLERYGLRWFAGLGFNLTGEFWCVSLQRRIDQGPFVAEELEWLRGWLVPIHDAATINQKLGSARLTGILEALELLAQPGFVLDERGRVIAANRGAEMLLASSIDSRSRQLRLRDAPSQARLDALVKSAIVGGHRLPSDAATLIRDARGVRRPIRAVALTNWVAPFLSGARVLLLMPPEAPRLRDPGLLRDALDLTVAEASLAIEVGAGRPVKMAAERLGITYATARSTLRNVFIKTGTHRQAELVALLDKVNV